MGLLLLSGGWTNIAFVLAILRGNVLRVLLLFYLSPLWATLLGWAFLKEKVTGASLFHLFLVMSGALLMLWDPGIGFPWPRSIEDWLALSSGLAFAVANAVVRKMDDISLSTKSVGVFIGVCMVSVLILTVRHLPFPTVSQETILGAAALGILGVLGMTVLVQYGVTHLPIHRSSVILLFELIVGAISQQVLTNEVVMPWEWAGGILIMVGAYGASRPPGNEAEAKSHQLP
jgi:drug/metabolite transporter (DMT)-like permease